MLVGVVQGGDSSPRLALSSYLILLCRLVSSLTPVSNFKLRYVFIAVIVVVVAVVPVVR